MKIIPLSVPDPRPDPQKIDELTGEEGGKAWAFLKADVLREAYLRKNKPRVVVVLEASTMEAAATALSERPHYRHQFIRFDPIPVGHLPILNICFHNY